MRRRAPTQIFTGPSGYQVQEGEDQEGQGEHHHYRPGERQSSINAPAPEEATTVRRSRACTALVTREEKAVEVFPPDRRVDRVVLRDAFGFDDVGDARARVGLGGL